MSDATQHFVLLLVAASFSTLGWLMAHYPERTYRLFTFGQPERTIPVGFCRVVGWVFAVVFAAGAVMQVVLTIRALLR